MEKIKELFAPTNCKLIDDLKIIDRLAFESLCPNIEHPRFADEINYDFNELINEFSHLPQDGYEPNFVYSQIINKLCKYIPNWKSPNLHYNVGAPTNIIASKAYEFATSNNIFTINNGLAGNTLIAEHAVVNILSYLIGIKPNIAKGWFTFGGTGINLYGLKIGICKCSPNSRRLGVNQDVKVFTTQNAHFGHFISSDWLGVGTDNVIVLEKNGDGSTNISDFQTKYEEEIKRGSLIGCIYLNGGTSYNHIVDNIKDIVKIRDQIAKKYNLNYSPHIHVDSVIGWFWLFYKDYNFEENPLLINNQILEKIKTQYDKISEINFADSWGADFHKGIGGCPVDSSIFILNNGNDANLLSKKIDSNVHMHQIAEEFSNDAPVNYTLENSRSAGPMLSALASLLTMGKNGYRKYLSSLIEHAESLKLKLSENPHFHNCDVYNLGFVVMIRLYPDFITVSEIGKDIAYDSNFVNAINDYNKVFFEWDYRERISKSNTLEYSYSTSFMTNPNGIGIHALKFYLVSPMITDKNILNCANIMKERKKEFDILIKSNKIKLLNHKWRKKIESKINYWP